ncbi:MAG: hypothetical protein IPI59_02405 [Sphingobacteriales bacterium]|jgi:hypothetical protein|nr:hypothetical protein [Sphingobacteriales bacterium]MBP9140715.1 hypothetical protein [Chitinophagales bacterium]MDA0197964.1 hypothetical protein [Bacteroidota bacterium]MBK6890532.1 hypothetical protein [Sphingobacteriales bacterium]MBK7526416.1 hypothetical protein [Sphingobacteriales bacterium]
MEALPPLNNRILKAHPQTTLKPMLANNANYFFRKKNKQGALKQVEVYCYLVAAIFLT